MLTATVEGWLLSDEGADEYDRIATSKAIPLKMNIFRWAAGIVAAAVALFFILNSRIPQEKPISPVEIAILTAKLKDGRECSYIMTIEEGTGNLSLVAVNIED